MLSVYSEVLTHDATSPYQSAFAAPFEFGFRMSLMASLSVCTACLSVCLSALSVCCSKLNALLVTSHSFHTEKLFLRVPE